MLGVKITIRNSARVECQHLRRINMRINAGVYAEIGVLVHIYAECGADGRVGQENTGLWGENLSDLRKNHSLSF